MKKIAKIHIEKNDEIALIAEKIIESDADEVILDIPRFSHLAESQSNFRLIKREADAFNKKIIVESVDDEVVEAAKKSGLEASNPFFAKSQRQFSDITRKTVKAAKSPKISDIDQEVEDEEDDKKTGLQPPTVLKRFLRERAVRSIIVLAIILSVLASLGFIFLKVLPRAEIEIITKKTEWFYKDAVVVDKAISAPQYLEVKIPGQIFSQKKNTAMNFAASGKKPVEKKAGGKIVVYNAYSSDPQMLVATTRFVTPEGKVFRLVSNTTVPGAKIVNSKIVPSSIEAAIIADKPGADYNIGPVNYFSIPGFKGTPKFEGFYGESKEPMKGGFIGELAFATESDIKKGKAVVAEALENNLKAAIYSQLPKDFKVIDGASRFNLLKQEVNSEVNGGEFVIFAEAEMKLIAFREQDLILALTHKAKNELGGDFEIKNFELKYGSVRPDFEGGKMSFSIDFASIFAKKIDLEALKQKILGKSEVDLKSQIFSLPNLESAKISLWPRWVRRVPEDEDKVKISID